MLLVLHIATLVVLVTTVSGQLTISLLKPQGIRFALQDNPGTSLVAFHYSINTPLAGTASGRYNVDVGTKTGNEWVHENPSAQVHPGDTVHYWYIYIRNGEGHTVTNQQWLAPVPTTSTTTTTTRRPSQPVVVTNSPTTPRPIIDSNILNSGSNTGSNAANTGSNTATGSNTVESLPWGPPRVSGFERFHCSRSHQRDNSVHSTTSSSVGTTTGTCSCPQSCTNCQKSAHATGKHCTSYPCLIFEDEFDTLNLDVWEHEITAGGGGNWEFNYYTNNRSNSYVRDSKLFIKPTLTIDSLNEGPTGLTKGALDLWGSQPGDVCTGNAFWGCRRDGTPDHIINPVQSARLRSSRGFNFKYGKVEVRAKMPTGDWLWPAIWMLPLRNAYGRWPASGEIDIVEVRGNPQYTDDKGQLQGITNAGSTLHFGSDFWHNKWPRAHGEKLSSSGSYGDSFHKYVLVWDEDHISISIDDTEILNVTPPSTMWEFGGLDQDGVENPWAAGSKMAPFDKEFFLILNVAVGGTAFFPDRFTNPTGKPWTDNSDFALRDFWNAKGQWYPTWHPDTNHGENAAMQVDYVRVWKLKP